MPQNSAEKTHASNEDVYGSHIFHIYHIVVFVFFSAQHAKHLRPGYSILINLTAKLGKKIELNKFYLIV